MTKKNARNECLKLMATGLNGCAVAIVGAGIVLPVLSVYFKVGPELREGSTLWYLIFMCAAAVIVLHSVGQFILDDLID